MNISVFKHAPKAAAPPDEAVVRAAWPLGDDVQQLHVGVTCCLHIYRVNALPVNECLFVRQWCFNGDVSTVNGSNDIGKPSDSVEGQLVV